jgi:tRNA-Thr(GGU) m(6)t(6)A37 methyltransferase TsaA
MQKIEVRPIGRVVVDEAAGNYVLEIDPEYREGLLSLETFGRVQVLWWAHGMDDPGMRSILTCELPYARGKLAGVFACRAEYRPNPIALTACGIVKVDHEAGRVVLDYIDAVDGTPLLDIKPYIPVCDRARESTVPEWFREWPEWIEDAGAFFAAEGAPETN